MTILPVPTNTKLLEATISTLSYSRKIFKAYCACHRGKSLGRIVGRIVRTEAVTRPAGFQKVSRAYAGFEIVSPAGPVSNTGTSFLLSLANSEERSHNIWERWCWLIDILLYLLLGSNDISNLVLSVLPCYHFVNYCFLRMHLESSERVRHVVCVLYLLISWKHEQLLSKLQITGCSARRARLSGVRTASVESSTTPQHMSFISVKSKYPVMQKWHRFKQLVMI
jgi:hypothetical protein